MGGGGGGRGSRGLEKEWGGVIVCTFLLLPGPALWRQVPFVFGKVFHVI